MSGKRIPVELPMLGESMVEGTVACWRVQPGDFVEEDQAIVEVTTDKVDAEVPSPVTGILRVVFIEEGGTAAVGAALAEIEEMDRPSAAQAISDGRVASTAVSKASPGSSQAAVDFSYAPQEGDRVVPMSPQRKRVAEHMLHSKQISAHATAVAEVDCSALAALRDQEKSSFDAEHGYALTYLSFIAQATLQALVEFPSLNASVVGESIVERCGFHLGIAVEAEKGLVTPVIQNAEQLSWVGLAEGIHDVALRARSKRLLPDDLKGGSFTISNLGPKGNLFGVAILNQPQVALLRMGEVVKRPVVRSVEGADAIVIAPILYLALTYDHRAVDGKLANDFLYRIRERIEAGEFGQ